MTKRSIYPPREERLRLFLRLKAHKPFRRMMARQGIDCTSPWFRDAAGLMYRALHTCATCPHQEACSLWLELEHARDPYPEFCPNAALLESCRADDSRST
jgi:Family of unknown function (DUF6455)